MSQETIQKPTRIITTAPLLTRGMTLEETKIICTHPDIPLREKLFFRMIYETLLRPFEVLNLQIDQWDRKQGLVTALKVKTKTRPRQGDRHKKDYIPTPPKTRSISPTTNELLRQYVSNRKKGSIFINEVGNQITLRWFNKAIETQAKLLSIQKLKGYTVTGKPKRLITCMALREAGERHHDNNGGSRKLSAEAAGHTMQVKERHYEKVGEDIEQITDSMKRHHPSWVEGW